jgi:Zn-dependent oligopeptidase
LDTEQTDILHPVGAKQLANRFLRKKKEEQEEILLELNIKKSVIKSCNNAKDRTNLYSSIIKGAINKNKNERTNKNTSGAECSQKSA